MDWKPLDEAILWELMNEASVRINPMERRFWDAVRIAPVKWRQNPYGNQGDGFWVVALMGNSVVWYNDVEHGFNWSRYTQYGTIPDDEYWCNQDDLEWAIRELMNIVSTGHASGGRFGPPIPGEYPPT